MKSIVIGLGETGSPLRDVLQCGGYDSALGGTLGKVNIMNICIPYSKQFIEIVKDYQYLCTPDITIIHSTVPIGTTSKIPNAVHSPILGMHNDMEASIRKYTKWVGGEKAKEVAEYLYQYGLICKTVDKSEETEALKLMCLMTYGVNIALAEYRAQVAEKVGFDPIDILCWDMDYNEHVDNKYTRPIITRPGTSIGGHCIIQNMPLLKSYMGSPLIDEILKFKPVVRDYADLATV